MIENRVNLTSGHEKDNALGHQDRARSFCDAGEEIAEEPYRKGSEKHASIHSEMNLTQLRGGEGNEGGGHSPDHLLLGDVEGDPEGDREAQYGGPNSPTRHFRNIKTRGEPCQREKADDRNPAQGAEEELQQGHGGIDQTRGSRDEVTD